MPQNRRYYRKLIKSTGMVFLAGVELEIAVKNFSVTGILVELLDNSVIQDVEGLFQAIETSALVDIYLPEMRLAGEVRIVRADKVDDGLVLAMEFVHIAYDVAAVFYKRKVYRKALEAIGHIFLNGRKQRFKSVNVSVEGLMIYLDEKNDIATGLVTAFEFERLNLLGEVEVIWVEDDPAGGTLMGLHYLHLDRERIKGIPSFAQSPSGEKHLI